MLLSDFPSVEGGRGVQKSVKLPYVIYEQLLKGNKDNASENKQPLHTAHFPLQRVPSKIGNTTHILLIGHLPWFIEQRGTVAACIKEGTAENSLYRHATQRTLYIRYASLASFSMNRSLSVWQYYLVVLYGVIWQQVIHLGKIWH